MAVYAIYSYGFSGIMNMMLGGVRVGGLIGNENTFGMVFSRAALVSYAYLISKKKMFYMIPIAFFTFFAFSSGSRKAILLIVLGIVAVSIFQFGFRNVWKLLLSLGAITLALYFVLKLPFMSASAGRLFDSLDGVKDASQLVRERMIQDGWNLFKNRPILGYGISNFAVFYGTYSHNNIIEILVSLGSVGFILYYSIHIRAGIQILLVLKRKMDWRFVVLLTLLGINTGFGWAMVQFYSRDIWVFMAVALASTERFLEQEGESLE